MNPPVPHHLLPHLEANIKYVWCVYNTRASSDAEVGRSSHYWKIYVSTFLKVLAQLGEVVVTRRTPGAGMLFRRHFVAISASLHPLDSSLYRGAIWTVCSRKWQSVLDLFASPLRKEHSSILRLDRYWFRLLALTRLVARDFHWCWLLTSKNSYILINPRLTFVFDVPLFGSSLG